MDNMVDSLNESFVDSLSGPSVDLAGELVECGMAAFVDDGILNNIPLISIATKTYGLGKTVKEIYGKRKLAIFINRFHNHNISEFDKNKYLNKLSKNDRYKNQQLEHVLILIDRYLSDDQPKMLADIFVAYLNEAIKWDDFAKYSVIIDRLLPGDYQTLKDAELKIVDNNEVSDSILRLIGLGLFTIAENSSGMEYSKETGYTMDGKSLESLEKKRVKYSRTEFGSLLVSLISVI